MARRLWPWAWTAYLSAAALGFAVIEWSAYRRATCPTLSRELRRWTRCQERKHNALIFAVAGALLARHIALLPDRPADGSA